MATNQVGNVVDINTLLHALNAQNHLQMLSQQARDNTGLQEECQSEDQASAENEENDFIAESESMLQSNCSRKNTNNQTFSPQVDSGQPPNEEPLVSQESSSFINSRLLQCLIGHVQAYPCLWNKASPEYKLGHKKKLVRINIASNLGIDGKSIRKTVRCLRYLMRCIY